MVPPNKLPGGWSLIAVGDNPSPNLFVNSIALISPQIGTSAASVTTLWAWNPDSVAAQSGWYFYAPSLDNDGTLTNYIASKGYFDFKATQRTLDPTTGFWVNVPMPLASSSAIATYMAAQSTYQISQLVLDLQAVERQWSGNGGMYPAAATAKVNRVKSFVDSSYAYVQATKSSGAAIDKAAIIELFKVYLAADLAWIPPFTMTAALMSAMQPYLAPGVNIAYTNAIALIDLM